MFHIAVIAVGKLRENHWKTAVGDMLQRLQPFAKIVVHEVQNEPITPTVTTEMVIEKEGVRILKLLPQSCYAIALEPYGKKYSSLQFADFLQAQGKNGAPIVFIIGGAAGLSKDVIAATDTIISLSDMTFPHEMARMILLEQLYRAVTILTGKKYHY
jgi:23S rRNA (pseudouridine1915-N3)-methyltransferase